MSKSNDIVLLCTTDVPEGYKVKKVMGMAWGSELRSLNLWKQLINFFKGFVGKGKHTELQMVMEARRACVDKMVEATKKLGANAIVGVRITGFSFRLNSVEFTAYGTAVVVEKKK
jgi:uncharacterized protein YbjQ (UPF0145 family)